MQEKKDISHTGRHKTRKKNTCHTRTATAKAAARVGHFATQQYRQGTQHRSNMTITHTPGEACAVPVKRRPRGKARRPQNPRLLLRWYSADHSTLEYIQTLTERLPHRYSGNLSCVTSSSGSEPIIIAYTPARAVVNATPQCMLPRYSFGWLSDKDVLKPEHVKHVWLSVRACLCLFYCCAKHVPTHIPGIT